MTSVLLSLSFLGFLTDPTPHDLPDGVVKVATQVIVEADKTNIRYDIGFNPTTLDQLLKEYAPEAKLDGTTAEKTEAFRKAIKEKIAESFKLKVDDGEVKMMEVLMEDDEVSKHVQVRLNLIYEILVKKEVKIEIHDSSFGNQARVWTAGFKSEIPIAVKESSTKAIPIRSKPEEKEAEDVEPFVIKGTVVKLNISVDTSSDSEFSVMPFFVLALALGGAGATGIMLVPNGAGDDDHDDHH